MIARTLRQAEAAPAAYPVVLGLSDAAAAIDAEPVWRRIESYVAHRWTPRDVVWIVRGAGEWLPPLGPAAITGVSSWSGGEWSPGMTLVKGPCGVSLAYDGPWRLEATVGDTADALPGDVAEAFRRLAEYLAAPDAIGIPGASRYSVDLGRVSETISRREDHMARALINSGAADLLRPYRRA